MINRVLGALLVLQLGLVVFMYWPEGAGPVTREALLEGIDTQAVLSIEITEGESDTGDAAKVQLSRRGDSWQLASGLPGDTSKVDVLLDALLESRPGYAIATSDSAAQRFSVSAESFVRRIVLRTAVGEHTAFLGSSPTFRKVHARRDKDSAVYVIELNSYDAPGTEDSWLDPSLLAQRDVSSLSLYGTQFTLESNTWTRGDGEAVDAQAIATLVQALAALQVTGTVTASDEDASATDESLRIILGTGTGQTRLTILNNPESERYYLRSNVYSETFATSSYDAERLIEAAKSLLDVGSVDNDLSELEKTPQLE